jgi:hypothetical protein
MTIQIDVHSIEENLIHMTRMLLMLVYVRHAYPSRGQSLYVATFHADPTELDGCTTPEKKVLPTPPLSPTEWSTGHASVSFPTQPLKQCT